MKYCDLIAKLIYDGIQSAEYNWYESDMNLKQYIKVGKPKYHLDEDGVFLSTKKTLIATDWNGQKYRITVEEE